MKPGCSKRRRRSTPRLPVLAGLGLVMLLGGMIFAWACSPSAVQAARQPQSSPAPLVTGTPASAPAATTPVDEGAPGGQATVPVTATLAVTPTVLATATLIPLPVITFAPTESTPTAILLSSDHHPAGAGFPKDPAPAWWAFLRRWSVPLLLLAVWTGLAIWVAVLLALAARSSNR